MHGEDSVLEGIEHFRARRRLPPLDTELLVSLIDEIALNGHEPAKYIAELFANCLLYTSPSPRDS